MKLFEELNDDNFLLYAMQNYYNPMCIDVDEFHQDLKRFKYIKRLLSRYLDHDDLAINLILNHMIIILNVFGYEAGLKMIEFKIINDKNIHVMKPFLIYLKVITNDKYVNVPMDKKVIEALRSI